VPATAGATTKSAELSKIEERVRQRQSMLLEQTNELQQLEKRLAAAEERKRQLESRGGFI
jgi:chromosome segregation ATPase